MPLASGSLNLSPNSLFDSSVAAALVKVVTTTRAGSISPVATRYAIRLVSTLVLPEPAPAMQTTGTAGAVTASSCWLLSPASRWEVSTDNTLGANPYDVASVGQVHRLT